MAWQKRHRLVPPLVDAVAWLARALGLGQAPNEGTLLERQDDDTIRIALRSRGVCRRSSARRPAWRVTRLHNTTCSTRLTRSCAGLR